MTAFAQLSKLPIVHVLGWTLLHFCWQGALVALLLACILAIVPALSSQLRYAAACAAMSLILVLPMVTFGVLATKTQSNGQSFTIITAAQGTGPVLNAGANQSVEPWTARCVNAMDRSLPAVIGFWLAGVILLLCRLNLGLLATNKIKSLAAEPAPAELQSALLMLKARLGIERTVKLFKSASVHAPTVIGWLKPVILIPVGCMAGLSPVQVEAIFAHELAHIRRHDYLVNLFQSIVETMLFYHPAVWWVSGCIRREREHCCDDLAVTFTGDRLAYARALSFLEELRAPAPAASLAATGGVLKMRIARLLGISQPPPLPRAAAAALLITVGTFAGLAVLGAARAQSAPGQKAVSTGQITGKRAAYYTQWLNQDVRWIITPEEKTTFLRLSNDQERDRFVRQFWEVRNADSGSSQNKFKQEHYRRIAFSNMHFSEAGEPGWETDRGHVYIVFGPPDSIDANPSTGSNAPKPFETWHYRSVQIESPAARNPNGSGYSARPATTRKDVDFRFVDECACGRYRLRSPWPSAAASTNPNLPSSSAAEAEVQAKFRRVSAEAAKQRTQSREENAQAHGVESTDNVRRSFMPPRATLISAPFQSR